MAALTDIEQAPHSKHRRAPSIDTSHRTRESTDTGTSKSSAIRVTLDPSVIELMNGGDDYADESDEKHQDPLFGSCCDLVKVCLIVDSIYTFQKTQVLMTILLGWSVVDPDDLNMRIYQDDTVMAEVDRLDMMKLILSLKEGLGIPFAIIGIFGACRFYKYCVLSMGIWCIVDLIWSILTSRWLSSFYVAFYIYPHFALFRSLRKGWITRENYNEVKHCCCSTQLRCCNSKE